MIFKRGKFYWYEFEFHGRRYKASTKVLVGRGVPGEPPPREKAKQVENAKRQELALGEVGIRPKVKAPAFAEFAGQFLNWAQVEKADKPKTYEFYRGRVKQLVKYDPLKSCLLDEIDEQFVAQYVAWRQGTTRVRAGRREKIGRRRQREIHLVDTGKPVSIASINRDLATLRRILNVAREWKAIASVPKIRLLSGEKNHDRVLTHEEERAYLAAAPDLLRDFAIIALDTGMRPEEVLRIRFENVRFEPAGNAKYGYIHNPEGKTTRAKRNLPITARVKEVLTRRHEAAGRPRSGWAFAKNEKEHVSYNAINGQHDRVMDKLDVDRWRLYDMRHTYLTRLGESGADPFTIQTLAGHASIVTSQRYVHPTPARIENAIAFLEEYNRGKEGARRPNP